jgi:hypothetical protein
MISTSFSTTASRATRTASLLLLTLLGSAPVFAQGEADLRLPDLSSVTVQGLGGLGGREVLMVGLVVSVLGLVFGMMMYRHLRDLPVHSSMLEISELIYETCKTYMITQGRFLIMLELFIGAIIVLYFGILQGLGALEVAIILGFSIIGIAGSYSVAWFGIRVNTFANSRTAFASLRGKPFPSEGQRRGAQSSVVEPGRERPPDAGRIRPGEMERLDEGVVLQEADENAGEHPGDGNIGELLLAPRLVGERRAAARAGFPLWNCA